MNEKIKKAEQLIIRGQISIQNGLREAYGLDWENDENFRETPKRIAKSILERCCGINSEKKCEELMKKTFPSEYNDMIIIGPVVVDSICPHHFENVRYTVRMGYIVGERRVGLSKPGRVIKLFGRQPILQETFTHKLANIFENHLEPQGVIVVVVGEHDCMTCRGLNEKDVRAITSCVRGNFLDSPTTKHEFFELWKLSKEN